MSLLNFNQCVFECSFSKKQIEELSDTKFENTYIATREFEERCCALITTTCDWYKGLSQKLLDIYTGNIDHDLYYSDSLVVDYLVKNYKDKIDTNRKFDFDEIGWTTYFFRFFTSLKNEHLTNAISFGKYGITATTTVEELISKGHSKSESEKLISLFKMRNQIIRTIETEKKTSDLAIYSFGINKLGWINVDRFMDEEITKQSTLVELSTFLVQIKSKDTLDFISVSLVIPSYNIAVFSIHNEGDLYSFTKKDDGYRKLPIGQNAIIVAFSYKDNKPYFGKQKIKIPKDGKINLSLNAANMEEIKQHIAKLME